jgi:hypothetical protein
MNIQVFMFAALLFPIRADAANLKPETLAAWDNYLRTVDANLQKQVRPGGRFLWTFEDADRAARVLKGEIVIAPAPGPSPRQVPGGLIHHWLGAVFLPNVTLDEFVAVTRDYDHYKDYYRPSVVESKALAHQGPDDDFTMVLLNKAFFLKNAMRTDYHSTHVRIDDCRIYSVSSTTRVQGIESYGRRGEHLMPEGDSSCYIWKMYTIARLKQETTGLYYELEAIALSRDLPMGTRFIAEPVVRRVSHDSLLTSLQKTSDAVRQKAAASSSPADHPAVRKLVPGVSPALSDKYSGFTGAR